MSTHSAPAPASPPPMNDPHLSSTESLPSSVAETPTNSGDGAGPLLLREWSDPPVAPAVVVDTTPDDTRPVCRVPQFTSYPVANLVRDFAVRTGLDQMILSPKATNNNNSIQSDTAAYTSDTATSSSNNNNNNSHDTYTVSAHPVANMVRDFAVRTGLDQMMMPPSNHHHHHHDDNNLSIRSDTGAYAATSDAALSASQHDPYTVSARTVDDMDMDGEGTEYIIVDGQLIQVPHYHLDDDDEGPPLRQKACRRGRMSRGFRKVRKFFSRKKQGRKEEMMGQSLTSGSGNDDIDTAEDQQQQMQQQNDESVRREQAGTSPPHSPRGSFVGGAFSSTSLSSLTNHQQLLEDADGVHPVAAAAAAKATSFRRQSSLGETSTHSATSASPTRKDRRKKSKVSWKKQQPSPSQAKMNRRASNRKNLANFEEDDRKPRSRPSTSEMTSSLTGLAPEPYYPTPPVAAAAAAASTSPLMPAMVPIHEALESREQSVTASFVGTADDDILEAGVVLPAAEAFIEGYYSSEYEEKLKRDDAIPASLVPTDADYKVDKEHAPDVEAMLQRAEQEAITDLDMSDSLMDPASRRVRGKSAGVSVPLSQACSSDELVHNDNLKVVLVGSAGVDKSSLARAIRQSTKKPRKRTTLGVEVHTWTASDVRFHLWDVQGATSPVADGGGAYGSPGGFADRASGNAFNYQASSTPNFGAHPGTQSLFFSSQSLYLLVWDLACNNPHTHPVLEDDSDDEGDGNYYTNEEAHRQADRALQEDIENRVLSWVDHIARRGPRSAILPVGLIPDEMTGAEAQRRCDRLYELLEARMAWYEGNELAPNVVLDDSKNILCVNYSQNYGIEQLQETIVAIATETDTSSSVFTHVGTPVPPGVVEVFELVKRVKNDHKLIWLDHILGELGSSVRVEDVISALHFLSSIGEILYFGTDEDNVLSQFVVLSRKWLVSAISCILRNDLRRELVETRRFMNMQCIYSEQQFVEDDVTMTLGNVASSCPLLSSEDAKMLWQSMSFMREAADRYWQLNESSASAPTMFYFLERLLVSCGIFLPLGMSNYGAGAGMERDEVFFVPSLLSQNDPGDVWTSKDIWTYRNSDAWTTTLCHSWLFRGGAPSDLFEHLTVALLKGMLYSILTLF